jgi:hypothetical protein
MHGLIALAILVAIPWLLYRHGRKVGDQKREYDLSKILNSNA